MNTGHKIHSLQETLFDNKALPSLKGASSSAIGFVSDVPAMGYQTYFVGPVDSDNPDQAHQLSSREVALRGNATYNSSAPDTLRTIMGRSMALTVSEATGQLMALETG